jgi:glycerol-3-phosphate acyltransferase PlsY
LSFDPQYVLIAAVAYLLGSIPFGLIIGRLRGIDIRQHGSGNIGATNVWRVLGKKWGLATFLCDMGKGLAAVRFAYETAARWPMIATHEHGQPVTGILDPASAGIAAALACILGHSFPIWLRFKGGKGVATSLGVLIGMMPLASGAIFALWLLIFAISRYVSLASLLAAAALPVVVIVFLFLNVMQGWAYFYFAVAAALLVIIRHLANIKRLLAGTENRFGKPKAESSNEAFPAAAADDSADASSKNPTP